MNNLEIIKQNILTNSCITPSDIYAETQKQDVACNSESIKQT